MTYLDEVKMVVNYIDALQGIISVFLYVTDYFGLPDEILSNKQIKRILDLAHKLYDEIKLIDLEEK